jgi:peptidoglycan/LPS O-acetylase OafA/YrhL
MRHDRQMTIASPPESPPVSDERRPGRLIALDGLRGVAAVAVLLHHIANILNRDFPFGKGYLAVDFFFILSGFVLALAYDVTLHSQSGKARYARARFARLYPMILLGSVLGLAAALLTSEVLPLPLWQAFLMQALCLPVILGGHTDIFLLNRPQWSLFFEIFANGAYAFASRHLGNRNLVLVILVSIVVLICVGIRFGGVGVGFYSENFLGGFTRVVFSFFVGVLLGRSYSVGRLRVPSPGLGPLVFLLLLFLVFPYKQNLSAAIFDLAIVLIAFPLIVVAGANTTVPPSLRSPAVFLGAASYPLYMIHLPILHMTSVSFQLTNQPLAVKGVFWAVIAVAIILLAWLLDLWIDAPARRFLASRHR